MNQTIDHLHLKGPDPIRSAHWYVNAFAAQVIKDDCVLPDESRGLLLEIGGLRFVVSGQPPGTTLTLRDQSSLGFYSGGLRYGLDHFAITVNKPLEQELALLSQLGSKALLPPRINRHGAKATFVEGPDQTRIEIVEYPKHLNRSSGDYTFNHIHLKGLDPTSTANWYMNNFEAELLEEAYVMSDESLSFILKLGGIRCFVSGEPPGQKLRKGDTSDLGFYVGGLRCGLDHFAFAIDGHLHRKLNQINTLEFPILQKPMVTSNRSLIAFIEGPDETRLELVAKLL